MAKLAFFIEDESLIREIMVQARYHLLTCEPTNPINRRMYIGLTSGGTFRLFFRKEGVKDAGALLLYVLNRKESGIEIDVRSELAGPETALYQWVQTALEMGAATREEASQARMMA